MNKWYFKFVIVVSLIIGMFFLSACSHHAPGYGNTSKCTICGKSATHSAGDYGYCDEHWKDATGF